MKTGYSTGLYGWGERWKLDGKPLDWNDIFQECRTAGLGAVELTSDQDLVKQALAHDLKVSAIYWGLPLHERLDEELVKREALLLAERLHAGGGSHLLVNADPKCGWYVAAPKSDDDFKRQGDNLSRIAHWLSSSSVRVCMHNHAASPYNAIGDLRAAIEFADSSVGLCVDTGWAHVAGLNPLDWITRYDDRIFAVHLRNHRGDVPTEDLIEGDLDLAAFAHKLRDIGYDGWLTMELWHRLDNAPIRTMTEDTALSIEWLRSVLK
ncbi:sugar phosphate isomerase/epimerase family protein [Cohnella yongneupensis]|uniref:Sugar phosphate isomerase/epimerase family protein n=1 Tax=Cohnella yongneupensis TaxID=425006 RepID=A0ABW0R1F3_9BACL